MLLGNSLDDAGPSSTGPVHYEIILSWSDAHIAGLTHMLHWPLASGACPGPGIQRDAYVCVTGVIQACT